MPPKPKFTREEITQAAFDIVEEKGAEALTARELGKRLGSSSCPIFTLFSDMDEVKIETKRFAEKLFRKYMAVAENFQPAYKKRGMQWVKFAQEHPKLFEFLFMEKSQEGTKFTQVFTPNHSIFDKQTDIAHIMHDYHADAEQAERLFAQMWTYTFGLCVLCASRVCSFSEEEIASRLGEIFQGMIYVIQNDLGKKAEILPVDRTCEESLEIERTSPDLSKRK